MIRVVMLFVQIQNRIHCVYRSRRRFRRSVLGLLRSRLFTLYLVSLPIGSLTIFGAIPNFLTRRAHLELDVTSALLARGARSLRNLAHPSL